ncbi:hypothetical protein [Intrasporangium sp. DVR]
MRLVRHGVAGVATAVILAAGLVPPGPDAGARADRGRVVRR